MKKGKEKGGEAVLACNGRKNPPLRQIGKRKEIGPRCSERKKIKKTKKNEKICLCGKSQKKEQR